MQFSRTDLPVLVGIRLTFETLEDEVGETAVFDLRFYPGDLVSLSCREDEVVVRDGRLLDLDAEWA